MADSKKDTKLSISCLELTQQHITKTKSSIHNYNFQKLQSNNDTIKGKFLILHICDVLRKISKHFNLKF